MFVIKKWQIISKKTTIIKIFLIKQNFSQNPKKIKTNITCITNKFKITEFYEGDLFLDDVGGGEEEVVGGGDQVRHGSVVVVIGLPLAAVLVVGRGVRQELLLVLLLLVPVTNKKAENKKNIMTRSSKRKTCSKCYLTPLPTTWTVVRTKPTTTTTLSCRTLSSAPSTLSSPPPTLSRKQKNKNNHTCTGCLEKRPGGGAAGSKRPSLDSQKPKNKMTNVIIFVINYIKLLLKYILTFILWICPESVRSKQKTKKSKQKWNVLHNFHATFYKAVNLKYRYKNSEMQIHDDCADQNRHKNNTWECNGTIWHHITNNKSTYHILKILVTPNEQLFI